MFSLRTWKVMKMWLLEAEPGGDHNTDNDTVMLKPPGLGAAKILSNGSQLIHFSISSSSEKQWRDMEDFSMTSFGSLKPTKSGSRQRNRREEEPSPNDADSFAQNSWEHSLAGQDHQGLCLLAGFWLWCPLQQASPFEGPPHPGECQASSR